MIVLMNNHIKQEKIDSIKKAMEKKSKEVKSLVIRKGNKTILKRTIINIGVKQISGMRKRRKIKVIKITTIIILMKRFSMLKDIIMMNQEKIDTKKKQKEDIQRKKMIGILYLKLILINSIKKAKRRYSKKENDRH